MVADARGWRVISGIRRVMTLRGGTAATARTLFANVFILGINLATGIITARFLGSTGRGEQAAMALWVQFFAYAFTLGLPSAVLYNFRRHPEQTPQLFSGTLILGLLMGSVAALAGVIMIPVWLASGYDPEVAYYARWLMLVAPAALLSLVMTYMLRAREEFGVYNAVRYLQPFLTLLTLVCLALTGRLSPLNAALAYVLPVLPIFVYMLVHLWKACQPSLIGAREASRSLISYGLRSYGADVVGILTGRLDRALVVGFLGPASMGLYVVALSVSQMLDVFQSAVVSVLFPKAMGRTTPEVVALAARSARVSTFVTLLTAVVLALFGPWLMNLVYGAEFVEAVPVLRFLLAAVTFSGTTWVLSQAFMALDRPGLVTILQGLGLGLSVLLLVALVPRYGLEGTGLAIMISAGVRLALVLLCFPLVLKVRVPRLWPTRADLDDISTLLSRTRERNP